MLRIPDGSAGRVFRTASDTPIGVTYAGFAFAIFRKNYVSLIKIGYVSIMAQRICGGCVFSALLLIRAQAGLAG